MNDGRYFPKGFSKVANSQMCNFPIAQRSAPNIPLANLIFGKLPLGTLHILEVAAWEISPFGSRHLGSR